jgi:hypothetical protein
MEYLARVVVLLRSKVTVAEIQQGSLEYSYVVIASIVLCFLSIRFKRSWNLLSSGSKTEKVR